MDTPDEIIRICSEWLKRDCREAENQRWPQHAFQFLECEARREHKVLCEARAALEAAMKFRGKLAENINAQIAIELYKVRRCKMLESLHHATGDSL